MSEKQIFEIPASTKAKCFFRKVSNSR